MKWHTTWLPKKDRGSSYQKIKASDARPAARVRRQAWGHVKLMHMRLASRSPNPNPLPGKLKAGPIGTINVLRLCVHARELLRRLQIHSIKNQLFSNNQVNGGKTATSIHLRTISGEIFEHSRSRSWCFQDQAVIFKTVTTRSFVA